MIDHFLGEKNGKKIGMRLFTAVNAVKKLILFKYLLNKLNNFINLKGGKQKNLIC